MANDEADGILHIADRPGDDPEADGITDWMYSPQKIRREMIINIQLAKEMGVEHGYSDAELKKYRIEIDKDGDVVEREAKFDKDGEFADG